jgi:hypothetical protein
MLHLHFLKQRRYFRYKIKIIFKQLGLKHSIKILGYFIAFLHRIQRYMKAALKTICYLSDIWNIHILIVFIVILSKLEIHLLCEKELKEEVHQFGIFFLLNVIVSKHHHTTANYQLSSTFLMLIDCTDWPITRIGQRTRSQNRICRVCNC